MSQKFKRVLITAAFAISTASLPACAQNEPFYQGKQIEFISAGEAGTNFDLWSRLLARHMPKYIAGNPKFIVRNIPGSGHIKAGQYLHDVAPKDGTTMGTFGSTVVSSYVFKLPGFTFDATDFNWIGSPSSTSRLCVAMNGARVQTADDLFKNELAVGGTGPTGGISGTPTLLSRLLGMKFKLVEGYPGPVDILLAMERGELDGLCSTMESFKSIRPGWIESGKLKVLFNMEREPLSIVPAPTIYNYSKSEEQSKIIAFYNSNLELGSPVLTPPRIPTDRLAILQQAFASAMEDSELRAEAIKANLEPRTIPGNVLTERVRAMANTAADIVEKTNRLLDPKLAP